MARKPRRAAAQNIINNLLNSEIPEIQSMANNLAEQIKELEEQSSRLQKYVTQIEGIATDEANALAESRIAEILKDLDAALKDIRQRPKEALATGKEAKAVAPRRTTIEEKPEEEVEEVEGPGDITPGQGMQLERVITPEGYIIKKARY